MRRVVSLLLPAILACTREPDPREIVVTTIATFGDTAGEGAIAGLPLVTRDARGRYFAASPFGAAPELVAVFDSAGRFVARIGAAGDGPGEYRQPNLVIPVGDSVWIFDLGTRRINFLSRDLQWRGSRPSPGPVFSAAVLSGAELLVNLPVRSNDSARSFFQRFDSAGRFIESYEEPGAPCSLELCIWIGTFVFRADSSGGLWAARQLGDLAITRYDANGRVLRRHRLAAPWFPSYEPSGPFPVEMMTGIAVDGGGRIWLAGMTTDPEAPDTARGLPGDAARLDGVLEVRDSLDGHLIAMRRFDEAPVLLPLGGGLVANIGRHEDGWARIEIWRMEVK